MTHPLVRESGGSADDRRAEADRLVKMIESYYDQLTPREVDFVAGVEGEGPVSPKQLFWLRDIKSKYAE